MRAIVSMTFFNTPDNRRTGCTINSLERLRGQVDGRHTIVAVDNGSTELTAWEWLQKPAQRESFVSIRSPEPMSVAQGVNTGWRLYEAELDAGMAVAVKFDSDMVVVADDWLERILALFEKRPEIGLAGPWLRIEGPDKHRRGGISGPGWQETHYIPGAVCARSPAYWMACGYARNPYGRWGWQDHWDVWRCNRAKLKMVIFSDKDMMCRALVGSGSLSRAYKKTIWSQGSRALEQLRQEVRAGKRPLREPFDGYEEV